MGITNKTVPVRLMRVSLEGNTANSGDLRRIVHGRFSVNRSAT